MNAVIAAWTSLIGFIVGVLAATSDLPHATRVVAWIMVAISTAGAVSAAYHLGWTDRDDL